MVMRLRFKGISHPQVSGPEPIAYHIHPSSFVASVILHCLVITALGLVSSSSIASQKSAYEEVIHTKQYKLIWYDFQKPLPEVTASEKIGTSAKPQGREVSKKAIVAASRDAQSNRQFVWQPVPKIELTQDLPAPNLVLKANVALAPPPVEPKPPEAPPAPKIRRAFVPPPQPP